MALFYVQVDEQFRQLMTSTEADPMVLRIAGIPNIVVRYTTKSLPGRLMLTLCTIPHAIGTDVALYRQK